MGENEGCPASKSSSTLGSEEQGGGSGSYGAGPEGHVGGSSSGLYRQQPDRCSAVQAGGSEAGSWLVYQVLKSGFKA